jgi:C-terminal processing protease CtpA/Prc
MVVSNVPMTLGLTILCFTQFVQPRKPLSRQSLRHSMAKKNDSKRSLYRPSPKDFDRPYTSDYNPMDRWMLSVKKEAGEGVGISIVKHKKDLFVADVEEGPFYKTALDKGDKILSINGKKVPKHITSVAEAEKIMEGKTQLTVFILRPDPEKDLGYKWVMENF